MYTAYGLRFLRALLSYRCVCEKKCRTVRAFFSTVFNVIRTVDMALNWYVCVFVCHGDLCSNLWCVLSLISFKTNVVH